MNETFVRVNELAEVETREPTYVAIGSFDGVHLGHQSVLQNMVTAAEETGARTAVITFFPHPKRVIQGLTAPYYITSLSDRVTWLAQQGIDLIITHPFNDDVRHLRANDFVEQLCRHLDMRQLWGGNFTLGYNREGDVPFLQRLGVEKGYTVELVQTLVSWRGAQVSSSRIRNSLMNGDIEDVNGCLGRPYRISGQVVKGDQRGKTIGFPTANLDFWPEQLLPAHGVYATVARVQGQQIIAATNVGVRPTIADPRLTVEAHLLDFDEDLYGKEITLLFMERIRDEMKFPNLAALKAQIHADVAAVRKRLG